MPRYETDTKGVGVVYENLSTVLNRQTYVTLKSRMGMGAQVKKTERRRKDLRPHVSERAPIKGAERKERMPCVCVCGDECLVFRGE